MSNSSITWYALDKDLKTCEHPPVDLERAVEVVEEYYARGAGTLVFEHGEDALAATMFGFSRSPSEFIEFCVNGPSDVSYKFEVSDPGASWLRKVFGGGLFQFETVLHSKAEMVRCVEEFFLSSPTTIKARLQRAE